MSETPEQAASRIAAGPSASSFVGGAAGASPLSVGSTAGSSLPTGVHGSSTSTGGAVPGPSRSDQPGQSDGAAGRAGPAEAAVAAAPFDPLRLCIFATVAAMGWAFGPAALLVFAAVGFVGYWRARRAGLTRSKCYLRDTRLVLLYLFVLAAAGAWGLIRLIQGWLG